jgi:hypothetical protein
MTMRMIRCTILFIVACWLLNASAFAQSASLRQRIFQNPHAEIETSIRIVQSTSRDNTSRPNEIPIDSCAYVQQWGDSRDDDFLEHFELIAAHYVHMERTLASAGYPEDVWRPVLLRLRQAQIDEIVRRRNGRLDLRDINGVRGAALPYERQLATAMNSYRARAGRPLPPPNVWGQCGGDYVGYVKIKGSPPGATIRLIREFYFKHCQLTNIPPFTDRCDKWTLIPATRDVPGGTYYYMVSWPNGPTECDRIDFIGATPEQDGKVITITRTGKACPSDRPR